MNVIAPMIAVGLFLIWIGFVMWNIPDGHLGRAGWPLQQAKNFTEFFNSHRIINTLFVICIALAIRGHYLTHDGFSLDAFAEDFYGNYFSEIIGIGATVFLIDRINRLRIQQREAKEEKERLIAEMGSTDNDVALFALKKIRQRGWHMDGSLVGLDFSQAVLTNANLIDANLQAANLFDANLQNAFLMNANLQNAFLIGANLQGTHLLGANLTRANLQGAHLQGTQFTSIIVDYLPDHAATLTEARLSRAQYNDRTLWPKGFDPQAAGAIREELSPTDNPDDQHD